jgi:hypothetical protein
LYLQLSVFLDGLVSAVVFLLDLLNNRDVDVDSGAFAVQMIIWLMSNTQEREKRQSTECALDGKKDLLLKAHVQRKSMALIDFFVSRFHVQHLGFHQRLQQQQRTVSGYTLKIERGCVYQKSVFQSGVGQLGGDLDLFSSDAGLVVEEQENSHLVGGCLEGVASFVGGQVPRSDFSFGELVEPVQFAARMLRLIELLEHLFAHLELQVCKHKRKKEGKEVRRGGRSESMIIWVYFFGDAKVGRRRLQRPRTSCQHQNGKID